MENKIIEKDKYYQDIMSNLKDYDVCINLSVNGPGESKYSHEAKLLVLYFDKLINYKYVKKEINNLGQGLQITYYINGLSAQEVKAEMIKLEDNHPLGRFVDIDVFEKNNRVSLSRNSLRKCYLCDKPAFVCQRNQEHELIDLEIYFKKEILNYFGEVISKTIKESILLELNLDPKFGLVTPYSNGSHNDMNYQLMILASEAIIPYLREMFKAAVRIDNPYELIINNQVIGKLAEEQMLRTTNNVNCYKGLIYNLGLIITASTYALVNLQSFDYTYIVAKEMSKQTFQNNNLDTFGQKVYKTYNFGGIRSEAMSGYPSIKQVLSELTDFSDKKLIKTLVKLITITNDSVLLKRSKSIEKMDLVIQKFKLLNLHNQEEVKLLTNYCIQNNLSFGGSADLLITSIYLKKLLNKFSFIEK
ncbi:MAG: triphosphoribosyl-dephospho-CoA synthase [Acholeplasmataceae bacterium]|jgi:holo-ACP synthase CitX